MLGGEKLVTRLSVCRPDVKPSNIFSTRATTFVMDLTTRRAITIEAIRRV
jgi:hypothetical protein